MNLAQYDLRSRAGVLTSEPRIVPGALQTVVVNHAMDRGPDLALVRLTCIVTDSSWAVGESWILTTETGSANGLTAVLNAGVVTVLINGTGITLPNRTNPNGVPGAITAASWKYEVICIWWANLLASL